MNMNKIKYPTNKFKTFALILAFAFSTNAFAATAKTHEIYMSIGNLCEYLKTYQIDENGTKNGCSFLPSLSGSIDYNLLSNLAVTPQLGFTMPSSGVDENVNRFTFFILTNVKYKKDFFNIFAGTGFYITRTSGPGGELELNNGGGTDSFPLPDEAVYSRNLIVNLGLGVNFNKEISAEIYTYIFNAFESLERTYSIGLTISYHFGEVL